jgi:hypothetical protein
MPRALTAYLKRADVPDRKALQDAIGALGLPLTLDDAYAPFATQGYLPCTLDGEDAGFDLRFTDTGAGIPPAPVDARGARDTALRCKGSGDPREDAAAAIVCAALAESFGALVREGETETPLSSEQLIARARSAMVD